MNSRKFFPWIMFVSLVFALTGTAAALPPRQVNALTLSLTAQAAAPAAGTWQIEHQVQPAAWNLLSADSGVSIHTIRLTRQTAQAGPAAVNGEIRVENRTTRAARLTGLSAVVQPGGRRTALNCPVRFPYTLAAGRSLACTYRAETTRSSGAVRAVVRTSGPVRGVTAQAAFTAAPAGSTAAVSVRVNGQTYGPYTDSAAFEFEQEYSCAAGPGAVNTLAEIVETGQAAEAQVQIGCWGMEYSTSAQTFADGQGWGLRGEVQVRNPSPADMWVLNVRQMLDPGPESLVSCGHDFTSGPVRIAPGGTLDCTYSQSLPDRSERLNYGRISLQGSRYQPNGGRLPGAIDDYLTDPASLSFAD